MNKNFIFCPVCAGSYFLKNDRYKNFTGKDLPEDTYRLCITCGYEIKFELQINETQENEIEEV